MAAVDAAALAGSALALGARGGPLVEEGARRRDEAQREGPVGAPPEGLARAHELIVEPRVRLQGLGESEPRLAPTDALAELTHGRCDGAVRLAQDSRAAAAVLAPQARTTSGARNSAPDKTAVNPSET